MRDLLLSKVDLTASRVKPYEGFIFLCGGPTNVRSSDPVSIRDAIYRELAKDRALESRVRVAEHYKDWAHESIYRDLVSFEQHLAELSSVIVLVLESPGSIAELGLFSVIKEFQRKLLIFIERDHYTSASFIKLGPVDFLEKIHENTAECHKWMKLEGRELVFDGAAARELQPDLAEAVVRRARESTSERLFDRHSWLDGALLLCDLLSVYSALTLREIRTRFEGLGCTKTEAELKQMLYILQKVRLLEMEPKGDQRFYVSVDSRQFLRFHIADSTFDIDRYRADLLSEYSRDEKKRFRAIQEARRRSEKSR